MNIKTISYGGILQMYCIGLCDGYTMSLPPQILKGLAADFDRISVHIQSDLYMSKWLIAGRLYIVNQQLKLIIKGGNRCE